MNDIPKTLDRLGRVHISKKLRESVNIKEGDLLSVSSDGNRIIITPIKKKCAICGSDKNIQPHGDTLLCNKCFNSIVGDK